jgi:hypothetical protein
MIKTPKVFILGAGASKPFGFPTGHELKEMILRELVRGNSSNLYNKLLSFELKPQLIMKFYNALSNSGRSSVDAFLEHRTEFLEIGKYCIAMMLIPREKHSNLFDAEGKYADWYEYIFSKMNTSFDEFDKNKISFITFNYDRSLEYYLFTALKNSYGKNDLDCAQKIRNLNIIHFYGKLGNLFEGETLTKPYKPDFENDDIINASKQILIMSECEDIKKEFIEAKNLLKSSGWVYFLGFGYSDLNLQRLGVNDIKVTPMGSGLGLEIAEIDSIKKRYNIHIADNNSNVLTFLKKYAYLD